MRNVRLLVVFGLFSDLRFAAPVLVIYFESVTGSYATAGLVIAAAYVFSAAFEIPTGVVSDRWGRRAALLAGASASVLSVAAYAMADAVPLLLVGAAFEGLTRALYSGNNEALLYDSLAENDSLGDFARRFGQYNSAMHVAMTIAGPVGSLLAAQSFRLVMWVTVIPQLLALALATAVREPPRRGAAPTGSLPHLGASLSVFRHSCDLRLLTAAHALEYGIGEAAWLIRPAFLLTVWPLWALGLAPTIGGLLAAISFWYAGAVVRRLGAVPALFGASVAHRLGSMLAFGWPSVASPLVVSATGLGQGIASTAQAELLQAEFTDEQRATIASMVSLAGSATLAISVVAIGAAAEAHGPATALLLAEVVLLVPLGLYGWLHRRRVRSLHVSQRTGT